MSAEQPAVPGDGAVFSPAKVNEQPSLFSEFELDRDLLTLDEPVTRKRYTARSLDQQLAKRDAILRALAEGHGLLRIAKAFAVSHHLVSTLRDSRPDLVAIEKKQLSGQLGRILKMSADRYEEALEKGMVPAGQIPVAFGIFADKKAMLDGDAGLVVEHRHSIVGSVEGFRERLRLAVESQATETGVIPQQKGITIDAEVVSDTSPAGERGAVQASGPGSLEGPTGGGGGLSDPVPPV